MNQRVQPSPPAARQPSPPAARQPSPTNPQPILNLPVFLFKDSAIDEVKKIYETCLTEFKNNTKLLTFDPKDKSSVKDIHKTKSISKSGSGIVFTKDIDIGDVFVFRQLMMISSTNVEFVYFAYYNNIREYKKNTFYPTVSILIENKEYLINLDNIYRVIKQTDGVVKEFWNCIADNLGEKFLYAQNIVNMLDPARKLTYIPDFNTKALPSSSVNTQGVLKPYFSKNGLKYFNAEKQNLKIMLLLLKTISQNFNPEDTTMLQACKARIDFLKDGIKFTNDVKKSDAILLIKEYNMIYSVYVNHDLNKNTLYTNDNLSIIIHNSVYQLNTDIVIGILYTSDSSEYVAYWKAVADIMANMNDTQFNSFFLKKSIRGTPSLPAPSLAATKQSSPAATKQSSPAAAKQPSPAATKQSSPVAAKQPSPTAAKQPSPAATKQSSPAVAKQPSSAAAKQPSPAAAQSAKKTINKLLKKQLTKSAYDKYKEDFKDISEQQCVNIIDELKQIDVNNVANKPKVSNPKNALYSKGLINYDSDIILTALSKCHDKYNIKDEITDLIDSKNLYLENRSVSSTQPSQPVQTSAATSQTSRRTRDLVDPIYIEEYRQSCMKLAPKSEITFQEYTEHMQKLVKIIFELYDKVSNKTSDEISFNLFDENILQKYKANVDNLFTHKKQYAITKPIIYNSIYSITSLDGVLSNTYLSKAVKFTLLRKFFNGGVHKYIRFNNNYEHTETDNNYEYHRYMSLLPKYHCLNNMPSKASKSISDQLLALLEQLNTFTKDFKTDYNIIGNNKPEYHAMLQRINNYSDDDANNKLLCVLYNNNHYKKPTISDYYYYFKYDGPVVATSVMSAYNYVLTKHSYQPLTLSALTILYIEVSYKGTTPLFSRVVNEAIQNHLLNDTILNDATINKISKTMGYINAPNTPGYNKEDIYIFHGTQNLMHSSRQTEINLLSFLSCSLNIYISINYATSNLTGNNRKKKGIIYIFKVSKDIKFVNFNDGLYQILLLPGTKIIIKNEINIGNILYVLCHVENNDNINFARKVLQNMQQNFATLGPYQITKYAIKKNKASFPTCTEVALSGTRIFFRPGVQNIFTMDHQNTNYIYTSLGKELNNTEINTCFNIEYTIHQHMINDCYKFFNVNCVDYQLFYNNTNHPNNLYTAWKADSSYNTVAGFWYDTANFLADCILSNSDCMNGKNYLKNNRDAKKYMLVWFKGCGMYNIYGYRKPRFNNKEAPYEYIGILDEFIPLLERHHRPVQDIMKDLTISPRGILSQFGPFLDKLETEYIEFLDSYLDIPHSSQEYKDIKKMIKELVNILRYRLQYFMQYSDEINGNIRRYISENSTVQLPSLGGDANISLSHKNKDIIEPYYKKMIDSKTVYSPSVSLTSSNKNPANIYESIKNIPLPSDTRVAAKYLQEPYKSYYATKNEDDIVDYCNDGYAVSNKVFEKILEKLGK